MIPNLLVLDTDCIGVGYRAALQGSAINFNLGYSHPISFQIPEGVQIEFDKENQNIFTISGNNKQLVGQVAANIRSFRKPRCSVE